MQRLLMLKGIELPGPRGPIGIKLASPPADGGRCDFSAARLREGLAAGASMEIDLRRHAEQGFVCLDDAELRSFETSGRGLIAAASVQYLRTLRMRGPDGRICAEPLLLLDDLVEIARNSLPDAVVQFDLRSSFRTSMRRR